MIERAIFTRLTWWPALVSLISNRVYPLRAPQNTAPPYVVYQRVGALRLRSVLGGSGQSNPRLQIDCYGETYAEAKAVADQVRQAMDNFKGTIRLADGTTVKVNASTLETDRDLIDATMDPELFRVLQEYSFWHDE